MATLSRSTRIGYALGGVASGTYGTVPGLILLPFLTDVIGIQAALAGVVVFAPKACGGEQRMGNLFEQRAIGWQVKSSLRQRR